MNYCVKGQLEVNNVRENAKGAKGHMVVRLVDGELWFYGLYEDEERARSAVAELGNAFIIDTNI